MRHWILVLGCVLAACGDGCCGCGGCDCGPLDDLVDDYAQNRLEAARRELRDIDPLAHAYIRATPEIATWVGGPVSDIQYHILAAAPDVRAGKVAGNNAKRITYDVTGPGGTKPVVVWVVYRDGAWVVVGSRFGTEILGEAVDFDPPPPSTSGSSSGGGGGGGFDWD